MSTGPANHRYVQGKTFEPDVQVLYAYWRIFTSEGVAEVGGVTTSYKAAK